MAIFISKISGAVFLFLIFFLVHSASSQKRTLENVTIKYGITLGLSDDYFLGEIADIDTDSQGKIYVADEGSMSIKVFNKNGELIKTIGRRGRGPGEFLSINEFYVGDGSIVIADVQNFRVSVFNLDGKLTNTNNFKFNGDIVYFDEIIKLPKGHYLVLYKRSNKKLKESDFLFHVWDKQFSEILCEFGSFKKLKYKTIFSKRSTSFGLGSFTLDENGDILYAPIMPSGKIYKFVKKGNCYQLGKVIKGSGNSVPSAIVYPDRPTNKRVASITYKDRLLYGRVLTLSEGIFLTDKNYGLNFLISRLPNKPGEALSKTKWKLGVEVYSPSLKLINYFPLDTLARPHETLKADIKKSVTGTFYMTTYSNDVPVVREFSLNFIYNKR